MVDIDDEALIFGQVAYHLQIARFSEKVNEKRNEVVGEHFRTRVILGNHTVLVQLQELI